MWATLVISVIVFLICAVGMGLGMLVSGRTKSMQRGTCGGTPIEVDGMKLTCSTCPNRDQPGHQVGSSGCAGLKEGGF
jgi:hypothetical protein